MIDAHCTYIKYYELYRFSLMYRPSWTFIKSYHCIIIMLDTNNERIFYSLEILRLIEILVTMHRV